MPDPEIVIFDLGGVLIDWDPRRLYRKLFGGDEERMERFLAEVCTPAWNHRLDEGRPFTEAIAELVTRFPQQADLIRAYHHRWPEMLGGPIAATVTVLESLNACGAPLWAITNWSAETFPVVRDDPDYAFLGWFQEVFVSGALRMAKPGEAIFAHALERIRAPARACLFIDDNPANLATAARLGMRTHRFTTAAALAGELRRLGLLAGAATAPAG